MTAKGYGLIRLIQQKHSGKVLEVVKEDDDWLQIINPEYPMTPFTISRQHYEAKWEPYKGPTTNLTSVSSPLVVAKDFNEGMRLPAASGDVFAAGGPDFGPAPRKRGRPPGSKNKPKP